MKKKAIIVTGAARRVGRALSIQCAKMGYSVIGHYLSSEKELETLSAEIKKEKVPFYSVSGDFSKGAEGIIEKCIRFPVQISGLINNASIFEKGNFLNLSKDEYFNLLTINTFAPLQLMNDFARHVKKGFIINLLDANVFAFNKNFEIYRMSKRFLEDITLDLALLYAPDIRVNAIAPGAVLPSKFTGKKGPWKKLAPLKTGGNIDDLSLALRYAIENKSITGQILFVDGGLHLRSKI